MEDLWPVESQTHFTKCRQEKTQTAVTRFSGRCPSTVALSASDVNQWRRGL
jgi:hypothetical protein